MNAPQQLPFDRVSGSYYPQTKNVACKMASAATVGCVATKLVQTLQFQQYFLGTSFVAKLIYIGAVVWFSVALAFVLNINAQDQFLFSLLQ